jgi:hypothetical protein
MVVFWLLAATLLAGCRNDSAQDATPNAASSQPNSRAVPSAPPATTESAPAVSNPTPVASPVDNVPAPAKNAGYTLLTYGPALALQPTEKVAASSAPLYVWDFFGDAVSRNTLSANTDGSITLSGGGMVNAQIASATASHDGKRFVGTAFGGGAYFEAVFKFDGWQGQSTNAQSIAGGFPAFWAMAVEHLSSSGADRWPGKSADFLHFAEFDFFEYNAAYKKHADNIYTGSVHDWYGEFNKTCPVPKDQFCQVQNAVATKFRDASKTIDFSQYHTYGALWVPATDATDGYLEWYLDGVAIGETVSWIKLIDQESQASPGTSAFGIADLQHMALIFGTGYSYPMTIKSVTVWQKSTQDNWVE